MAKKSSVKLSDLIQGQQNLGGYSEFTSYRDTNKSTQVDRVSKEEFLSILSSMGQGQTQTSSGTIPGQKPAMKVFEEFIKQTQKREELLKDATEEQVQIFKELETVLLKLKTANADDSKALRKTLADLNKQLAKTTKNEAQKTIQKMVPPVYRAPSYATPLTAATGHMFEGSAALTPEEQTTAKPKGDSAAIGGLLSGLGSAIEGIFNKLAAVTLGKSVIKALERPMGPEPKGKPSAPGAPEKPGAAGEAAEPKLKPKWYEAGSDFNKVIKRGGTALAVAGAANEGYKEFTQTKNVTKGAVVGGATLAGAASGALAGGKFGAAIGSVVGPEGTAIGGLLGAAVGGYLGAEAFEDFAKGFNKSFSGDPLKNMVKSGVNKVKETAAEGKEIATKEIDKVSTYIKTLTFDNEEKKNKKASVDVGQPIIINNNNSAPASGPQILAPATYIRPTESAFNRNLFRNYQSA